MKTKNKALAEPSEAAIAFERAVLVESCIRLFNTGIFQPDEVRNPLFEAAITQLLIFLNDLLQRADNLGVRVAFRDDIPEEVGDVTDLIREMRNAACHMRSKNASLDFGVFRLGIVSGKVPTAVVHDGKAFGSDYEDDIAVFFGPYRMYLNRHAARATTELEARFCGDARR